MNKSQLLYQIQGEENRLDDSLQILPHTEEEVWEQFIGGDLDALSQIYRRYIKGLYNYGRQFADHTVVMDCIQDFFHDLLRTRTRLGKVKYIKAYCYSSVRRRIVRRLMKNSNSVNIERNLKKDAFIMELRENPFNDSDAELESRLDQLKKACNELPPRQREAILLHFYENMRYPELSMTMGIGSVNSARILVSRAIHSLRKKLKY